MVSLSPTARLVAALAIWNVLQNAVPRRWYGWLNTAGTAAFLAMGRSAGLSWPDVGLGAGAVNRGLAAGGPLAAGVVAATQAIGASSAGLRLFRDERVTRGSTADLLQETLFHIPIGTALFEEVAFRGVLHGQLAATAVPSRAVAASSAAFGIWHVIPTAKALDVYRGGALADTNRRRWAMVAGAVFATTAAGIGLGLLRVRARSVVAPVLVHAAVNVSAYVNAWRAAPRS